MKRLLCVMLCALLLCGCGAGERASDKTETATAAPATEVPTELPTEPETEPPTEPPTDPPTRQELAQAHLDAILGAQLSARQARADVPEIFQNPDLPTGCETVALVIALNALGCEISGVEFASKHLIIGDDIIHSFVGDPFVWGGAGIYPPGLTESAERYLATIDTDLAAFDLTGVPMSDLYKLIQSGYPVVVWTTYYFNQPWLDSSPYTYNGHTVYWYDNEHCVCLYGYDEEQDVVYISDPLQGKVTDSASNFESVYEAIGRMAMVVVGPTDPA